MPCDVLLVHYLGKKRVNVKVVRNGRRQCFTWKDFGNYLKAQSLWRKTTRAAVARKQWPNAAVCIPLQTEWFLSPPARSHPLPPSPRQLAVSHHLPHTQPGFSSASASSGVLDLGGDWAFLHTVAWFEFSVMERKNDAGTEGSNSTPRFRSGKADLQKVVSATSSLKALTGSLQLVSQLMKPLPTLCFHVLNSQEHALLRSFS